MFCRNCGHTVSDDQSACPYCQKPLGGEKSAATTPLPTPVPQVPPATVSQPSPTTVPHPSQLPPTTMPQPSQPSPPTLQAARTQPYGASAASLAPAKGTTTRNPLFIPLIIIVAVVLVGGVAVAALVMNMRPAANESSQQAASQSNEQDTSQLSPKAEQTPSSSEPEEPAATSPNTKTPANASETSGTSIDQQPQKQRLPVADVESEVSRIRAIWTEDREAIAAGSYETRTLGSGVTGYYKNGELQNIEVTRGTNGVDYSRIFQYESGKLIFAYYEGNDQNRLYFLDDFLFRWRYTPPNGDAVNYDNDASSSSFLEWENVVLEEGYRLP